MLIVEFVVDMTVLTFITLHLFLRSISHFVPPRFSQWQLSWLTSGTVHQLVKVVNALGPVDGKIDVDVEGARTQARCFHTQGHTAIGGVACRAGHDAERDRASHGAVLVLGGAEVGARILGRDAPYDQVRLVVVRLQRVGARLQVNAVAAAQRVAQLRVPVPQEPWLGVARHLAQQPRVGAHLGVRLLQRHVHQRAR